MTTLLMQQQAGLGLGIIGWIVVIAVFYFLKDVVFKKNNDKDNNDRTQKPN